MICATAEVVRNIKINDECNARCQYCSNHNIKNILNLDKIDKIEGIHISRHHYNDIKNNKIFGIDVASCDDIKKVMEMSNNKRLIRLNCLLLKGNIDNIEEVNYGKNICECINGVYVSDEGKVIEYYARMTKELVPSLIILKIYYINY